MLLDRLDIPDNSYTPDGQPIHEIITARATDNSLLGQFRVTQNINGSNLIALEAFKTVDGTQHSSALKAYVEADGTERTECITPNANSNGIDIASTQWVRQNASPTGSIIIWSTLTPPYGHLICDGSAISRTTYSKLFGVIGTTYGEGDGTTTFNLPNFNGRTVFQDHTMCHALPGKVPNITGSTHKMLVNRPTEATGVFYWSETANVNWNVVVGSGSERYGTLNFDASRSSTCYDSTATSVVPSSLSIKFCIKYI